MKPRIDTDPPPRRNSEPDADGTHPFADKDDRHDNGQLTAEQKQKICKKAKGYIFKSLVQHAETPIDHSQTLLGNRWLCKGGVALVVAPSGVGKSSAVEGEMAVKWSCGKEAFGIKPARPLKILIVQAENDQGDTTEMLRDIVAGLSEEDKKTVNENTWCSEPIGDLVALNFVVALSTWIDQYKPDLVIVDPMNSYTGGDPSDPDVLTPFFRHWLIPTLRDKQVGCIVVHHMPKMRGWDTKKWKHTDWMNLGAGNAEQTNVSRAGLAIDATDNPKVYKFVATKRRQRIGWSDMMETAEWWVRYYKHSDSGIAWGEADEDEVNLVKAKAKAKLRRSSGKYPLPDVLVPLLKAGDDGLTCRELHRALQRSGSDIKENLVWKKLSKAVSEGFVEMDKSDCYTLTESGMELFS